MTVLLGFALALLARAPLAAAEAAAAAGSGVVEEAVPWLGVRVDPARMVNQHLHAGDGACVPATLINALRCGPADFQRAPRRHHRRRAQPAVSDRGRPAVLQREQRRASR
jgi:hypothetical protein